MTQTNQLIAAMLPRDIAWIVSDYFGSSTDDFSNGEAGRFELCELASIPNLALRGAIVGKHIDIIMMLVDTMPVYDLIGMAIIATNMELPMVAKYLTHVSETDPRHRLYYMCRDGNFEYVAVMDNNIDWNYGLSGACVSSNKFMMRLSLERGAIKCHECRRDLLWHKKFCNYTSRCVTRCIGICICTVGFSYFAFIVFVFMFPHTTN
jgi:hypothetical protein